MGTRIMAGRNRNRGTARRKLTEFDGGFSAHRSPTFSRIGTGRLLTTTETDCSDVTFAMPLSGGQGLNAGNVEHRSSF